MRAFTRWHILPYLMFLPFPYLFLLPISPFTSLSSLSSFSLQTFSYFSLPHLCSSRHPVHEVYSIICIMPSIAYRLRYTICRSGDPQIFLTLPPPTGWTLQRSRCCPIYAPQYCPKTKAPMAI